MQKNPFSDLTRKAFWQARLQKWRDALLRPVRPSRIAPGRRGTPNLLLLGIDTLRWDHLGRGGCGSDTSPHLDRLSGTGTVFADVTAPAPWTLPSFAGALTGVMPGRHGALLGGAVRHMDQQPPGRLDPDVPTLAGQLRRRGYRTAAFYSNQFFGFGLAESFDHHGYHNLPAGDLARLALEWIRRHADEPFFCFVLFNDPHEPTTPAPEDLEPFLRRAASRGAPTDAKSLRSYARWGERGGYELGRNMPDDGAPDERAARDHALTLKLALYDAAIHEVDRAIGGMQEHLDEWELAARTVVSVFSDHGEEFLDHEKISRAWNHDPRGIHGVGHGHTHFQELLHVPWMAWGPNVPAGQLRRDPVSLCDLAPTMLEWLQITAGDEIAGDEIEAALRGRSVAAEPHANDSAAPRLLLAEDIAYGPDLVALRRGPWKFIAHRDGRPLGLYRLSGDPGEQNDVAAGHPELVAEFQELLARWRAAAGNDDGAPTDGAPKSWDDLDDTVRQRLKDLGYSD